MDLYAYAQIEKYQKILDDNQIKIARLRGLRLMKEEELITDEDIQKRVSEEKTEYAANWLRQHSDNSWCNWKVDKHHKSFIYGKDEKGNKQVIGIDLSKIHGKNRKRIKYHWKRIEKAFTTQYEVWNKYVGKNVLYVHARQGGGNRSWYPIDTSHPMYLEDIDDAWDGTYCDIYYDLEKAL